MTYDIIETSGLYPYTRKNVLATAANLADAIALAHDMFVIIDLERDPLNQHCADLYTSTGRVMSIEPRA